jgi:hypothetical protein
VRKLEFKLNPNGVTRIFVDDVELNTKIDPIEIREYRYSRGGNNVQYSILLAEHIINTILKKLETDIVVLTALEIAAVIKYLKRELGI